jgi:ATP-dependent helicase Lhr and Lhr-like helicase
MQLHSTPGYQCIASWLSAKGLHPFAFQEEAWQHICNEQSGLVNAPTGCGKTYSVFLGSLISFVNQQS